jgi:hypothetical protein
MLCAELVFVGNGGGGLAAECHRKITEMLFRSLFARDFERTELADESGRGLVLFAIAGDGEADL